MSNEALTWAFKFPIKAGPKFVLVALADYADEEHSCYPSLSKLHDKTCIAEKTISVHLAALEKVGLLTRSRLRYKDGNWGNYRFKLLLDNDVDFTNSGLELKAPKARGKAFKKKPTAKLAIDEPHAKSGVTNSKIGHNHTLILGDNNHHIKPSVYNHKDIDAREIVQGVYQAWNAMASVTGLTTVKTNILHAGRSRQILGRLKDCHNDFMLLHKAISNVPNNPHWLGQNNRGWRADFDWVFKPANFAKVLEFTTPAPKERKQNDTPNTNYKSTAQKRAEQHSADLDTACELAIKSGQRRPFI